MKITIIIEDSNNEVEILKEETVKKEAGPIFSSYARFFDESCPGWSNDSEANLTFLKMQEQYATEKLRAQGYLFLNDVYDMLGMPRTKAGQVVGWIYDENNPLGDNRVDFGIYDECNSEFVNGYKNIALLDCNVDGNILGKF